MGTIDISQYVAIEASGGIKNSQEILTIEKQRQLIIEGMKQNLVNLGYSQEKINTFKFDVVGNIGIIINSKGNLNSWYKYLNGKVEFYTNIKGVEKNEDLIFGEQESGYTLKDGKLFQSGQEIPQFLDNLTVNPRFVIGIDNINFYEDIQNIFGGIKSIDNNKKIEFDIDSFERTIISGVSRIEDVMYFYIKGYIPKEEMKKLLKRAIKELPNQSSDLRFYKNAKGEEIGMEVTKEELDAYLSGTPITKSLRRGIKLTDEELKKYIDFTNGKPLIIQEIYDECLKKIEARDKKIAEKNEIKEQSKVEIKIEGTKNGFIEKALNILKGIF